VVQVATDAPLPERDDSLPVKAADPAALEELGERWGLGSSLHRMCDALAESRS
jgi:hypothetical protein